MHLFTINTTAERIEGKTIIKIDSKNIIQKQM